MDIPLQPLRIPSGWLIQYNDGFYEIDPSTKTIPEEIRSCYFKEDMLQLRNCDHNRLLDLGWYPDGNLKSGEFAVRLFEGDFRGQQLHEFRTRDRLQVVAEIERLLNDVTWST